eukprot:scaffold7478_cov605-Prasinococcus_capsulatus_cf.AAC.1
MQMIHVFKVRIKPVATRWHEQRIRMWWCHARKSQRTKIANTGGTERYSPTRANVVSSLGGSCAAAGAVLRRPPVAFPVALAAAITAPAIALGFKDHANCRGRGRGNSNQRHDAQVRGSSSTRTGHIPHAGARTLVPASPFHARPRPARGRGGWEGRASRLRSARWLNCNLKLAAPWS